MSARSQSRARTAVLTVICAILLPGALVLTGCGDGTPKATKSQKLLGLVSSMDKIARDPKLFQSYFASGAAPAEAQRERYTKYSYHLKEEKVSGGNATATVVVRDRQSGNELGELEWTAVQEGDSWKLEKAPLP